MPTTHKDPSQAGAYITRDNLHWGTTLGSAVGPITLAFRAHAPTYNSRRHLQGTVPHVTTQEMAAAETAIRRWSEVANITFTEVNPGGYTNNATILFANYTNPNDGAQAFAYFPASN